MADEHTFTLVFEASGEVTPASKLDGAETGEDAIQPDQPETEEAEQ